MRAAVEEGVWLRHLHRRRAEFQRTGLGHKTMFFHPPSNFIRHCLVPEANAVHGHTRTRGCRLIEDLTTNMLLERRTVRIVCVVVAPSNDQEAWMLERGM